MNLSLIIFFASNPKLFMLATYLTAIICARRG